MIPPPLAVNLIRQSAPRSRLTGRRVLIYLPCSIALGVFLANPPWLHLPSSVATLAPLLVLTWLAGLLHWERRRQIRAARRWTEAQEAVQLEHWEVAGPVLCELLSKPVHSAALRTQGLLGLAAVADHHHEHDTCRLIYQHILSHPGAQPAQQHAAAIGMASTLLRGEDLTSAVRLIDHLARQDLPRSWKARIELVQLFREVIMGQTDDIIDTAAQRRELFRDFLSVRSGYGYALMALGHHRRGLTERAAAFWRDATLLITPERLLDRFPMLAEIHREYHASETPLVRHG